MTTDNNLSTQHSTTDQKSHTNSPLLSVAEQHEDKNGQIELKSMQNNEHSNSVHHCVISDQDYPSSHFQQNHTLTLENYDWIQTVLGGDDKFDPDKKMYESLLLEKEKNSERSSLKISDFAFSLVKNRYDKYFNEDAKYATCCNGKEILKNSIVLVIMTFVVIVFLLVSAIPIWAIEGGNELKQMRENNITLTNENNSITQLEKWNYGNSVYYCLVTFTTIGYGDFYATTTGGRVYIGFFGLAGIAIMGSLLVIIGKTTTGTVKSVLMSISIGMYKVVNCCRGRRDLKLRQSDRLYKFLSHLLTQLSYYTFFWLAYVFVCAAIFMAIEGWSYGDACWYCFVTLGTIGYGDYYPKTRGGKVFFMFFAIIGLGFEAIMIGLISEVVLEGIDKLKKKVREWWVRLFKKRKH